MSPYGCFTDITTHASKCDYSHRESEPPTEGVANGTLEKMGVTDCGPSTRSCASDTDGGAGGPKPCDPSTQSCDKPVCGGTKPVRCEPPAEVGPKTAVFRKYPVYPVIEKQINEIYAKSFADQHNTGGKFASFVGGTEGSVTCLTAFSPSKDAGIFTRMKTFGTCNKQEANDFREGMEELCKMQGELQERT